MVANAKPPPTIWIVDDAIPDHKLIRIAFGDYVPEDHFKSYYSAEEAMNALVDGGTPSLVLLDLNMPGGGGTHFLEERRRRDYMHIPVVVLSSSSNPDDIRNSYALGTNSYLEKPQDLSSLNAFASAVYDYWFKWAHLPMET